MLRRGVVAVAVTVVALVAAAAPAQAQLHAGAAALDASWHVGASAGQYASNPSPGTDPEFDPSAQQSKRAPSYGLQSRLSVRALVFQGTDGNGHATPPVAIAKTDLYIPQDLLWRRAAQILSADTGGAIGESNLTMVITHDHSSPYYSSTAFGAWAFQDVIDIRFYDYYAKQIARAVEEAWNGGHMHAARVGASPTYLDTVQQNVPGPQTADNGTPAGYPKSWSDHNLSVVRFDNIDDPAHPRPLGNLVSYSLHGESLEGNDLISADWVGPFQRMFERRVGDVPTVYMQDAVGNSETEQNTYHDIHHRFFFEHKQYAQTDWSARQMADAAFATWQRIGAAQPDPGPDVVDPAHPLSTHFVPFSSDPVVAEENRWFAGPYSHPYPAVGNCRTDTALGGNPQVPAAGLPDCAGPGNLGFQAPQFPFPSQFPAPTAETLAAQGIPVPANYGAPGYGGLEESLGIHLQAIRIGELLMTLCSCEQWNDQAQNIRTRTDKVPGNEWLGYNWADPQRPYTDGQAGCFQEPGGTWNCPDPRTACSTNGQGETVCPDPAHRDTRITGISDHDYQVFQAQVLNDAGNWNDPTCPDVGCGLQAESESANVGQIRGGYTHDDVVVPGHDTPRHTQQVQSTDYAQSRGYTMTIPVAMANDYNGYIATYREFQRGDHYRKALTGYGPHSSDYLATRLVWMGHSLKGDAEALKQIDQETVPGRAASDGSSIAPFITPLLAKMAADQNANDAKAQSLGAAAEQVANQYSANVPNDGGGAGTVEAPRDVQRFDASFFSWIGGDNYVDNPTARVERQLPDGSWSVWADQTGELPTFVKYPHLSNTPDYLQGNQRWQWTADFEAFVSRYPLIAPGGGDGTATPPGTYRFHVEGLRQEGGKAVTYKLDSKPFRVGAYSGLEANGMRAEPDATVSFVAGPIHDRTSNSVDNGPGPVRGRIGPIDYPDSYAKAAADHGVRFVNPDTRVAVLDYSDPAAGTQKDPARLEWYCLNCTFRPWLDFAPAARATVTFAHAPSAGARAAAARVERVPAHLVPVPASTPGCQGPAPGLSLCDRWTTSRRLGPGEAAYVCPGDLQDAYGNYNGVGSAIVSTGSTITLDCPALEDLVQGPVVAPRDARDFGGFAGGSTGRGIGVGGRGQTGSASALGLPLARRCVSRRSFAIRVRSPRPGLALRSATIRVNGRAVRVLRGRRLRARINLRGLPTGTFRVSILVVGGDGRRYLATRTYHTCRRRPRGRGRVPARPRPLGGRRSPRRPLSGGRRRPA